jgi:hypothetical protein
MPQVINVSKTSPKIFTHFKNTRQNLKNNLPPKTSREKSPSEFKNICNLSKNNLEIF